MEIKLLSKKEHSFFLPNVFIEPQIHIAKDVFVYCHALFSQEVLSLNCSYKQSLANMDWWIGWFMHQRRPAFEREDYIYLPGTYLYCDHFYAGNYHHYHFQSLGALLLAWEAGLRNYPIIMQRKTTFHDRVLGYHHLDHLNFFSLDPDKLYKLERVIYTDCHLDGMHGAKFISLFEKAAAKTKPYNVDKLYVTRINNKLRSAINEQEVIDFLKQKGFSIYNFDEMPMEDQIGLINGAKTICAMHGGSGTNMLYRNKKPLKYIELFGNRVTPCHAYIFSSKKCAYTGTVNPAINSIPDSSYTIDLDLLSKALDYTSHYFNFENYTGNEKPLSIYKTFIHTTPDISKVYELAQQYEDNGVFEPAIYIYKNIFDINYDINILFSLIKLVLINKKIEELPEYLYSYFEMIYKNNIELVSNIFDVINKVGLFNESILLQNKFVEKFPSINIDKLIQSSIFMKEFYKNLNENEFCIPDRLFLSANNTALDVTSGNSLINIFIKSNSILPTFLHNKISLFHFASKQYISNINDDSSIDFSPYMIWHEIQWHNEINFSIKMHNKWLRSNHDGTISLSQIADYYCRFFINSSRSYLPIFKPVLDKMNNLF